MLALLHHSVIGQGLFLSVFQDLCFGRSVAVLFSSASRIKNIFSGSSIFGLHCICKFIKRKSSKIRFARTVWSNQCASCGFIFLRSWL